MNENAEKDVIETVKVEEQTENLQESDKKGLSISSMVLGIITIGFTTTLKKLQS